MTGRQEPIETQPVLVWGAGKVEWVGGASRNGPASTAGPRYAAALPLDVPVQVVGAREALGAVLALVGPHARMDAQVVLQVVVVHKL